MDQLMNRTVRIVAGSAMGIALATTASCSGGGGSASQQVVSDGTLTMAVPVDPGNLDPQHSAENVAVSRLAYDTPITIEGDGKVEPGVVSSWKDVGSTSEWSLTVRKDVTCSDGSTMGAATVAANINYVADPKNASPFTGSAVPAGSVATADAATNTVTVRTPSPSPFFVQGLQLLSLVCSKGLTDRKLLASASDGSGPYVISQSVPGDHVTYTLRKGYDWGPPGDTGTDVNGMPATVIVKTVTSYTTTANLLLSGQLNAAQVQGTDSKRLTATGLYSAGGSQMNDSLLFNQAGSSPAADTSVRRALLMALDMSQLGAVDGGSVGAQATGLLAPPKVCPGNTMSGNLPAYDPTQAKALLDSDGWTVGPGGTRSKNGTQLSLTVLYGSNLPATNAAAEFIAAQWGTLGVAVSLVQKPSDQLVSGLFGGTAVFDAVLQPIEVSTPAQLIPLLSGATPPNGENAAAIKNTQYDTLAAQAAQQAGTSGCAAWNDAEAALFKDADIAPLATVPTVWWGKNARFTVDNEGVINPTSMRLLAP
jgi:peptide/nickel transport system substrate-binding protein